MVVKLTATLDEPVSDSHVFQLGALKSRRKWRHGTKCLRFASFAWMERLVGRIGLNRAALINEAEIASNLGPEHGSSAFPSDGSLGRASAKLGKAGVETIGLSDSSNVLMVRSG
jgi:hypothetical protein